MDPQKSYYTLTLLLILSLHLEVIYGHSSAIFLDSPTRNYLRNSPAQTFSLSPLEVGATTLVLLGLAPPSTLTDSSSSKLNKVLMPNPFDRPHAVLMLEVSGAENSQLIANLETSPISAARMVKVVGNQRVDIELPDDGVSLVSLNDGSSNTECSDKELSDFASWLGGSYVEDASGPLNGELSIPMVDGAFLRLHMSERADKEYITSLVLLINNIRRTMEIHQVVTKNVHRQAELITGRFDGMKAMLDHYGTEDVVRHAMEVFVTSISKTFDSLQAAYQGQIVGVIVQASPLPSQSENMLQVTVTHRPSARRLEEAEDLPDLIKIAEVAFVRRTLAWITGIILLIATLLGIHFLLNMPLTKDTLLYSNVKLD